MDVDEQVAVVDDALRRVFRVNPVTDRITAAAGTIPGAGGERGQRAGGTGDAVSTVGVTADVDGSFYVSDVIDNVVRKVGREWRHHHSGGDGSAGGERGRGGAERGSGTAAGVGDGSEPEPVRTEHLGWIRV